MSHLRENRNRTLVFQRHLAPQTGTAFLLEEGQILRITDPQGEQVSDLTAFRQRDTREYLSSGRSIDYANTIYLTKGNTLYSNQSRPFFTITEDTVGRHDFLLTPCSPETFQIIYDNHNYHPSCFENLWRNLAPYGITPNQIPVTFNIFMDVQVAPETGTLTIAPPRSRPGDYIELRAETDLVVGVTACSAELSNNGTFKPIDIAVYAPETKTSTPIATTSPETTPTLEPRKNTVRQNNQKEPV